jgi:hypothetical protein
VASVVRMRPVGVPKGTLINVFLMDYNIFYLTLTLYQTKIFSDEGATYDQCPTTKYQTQKFKPGKKSGASRKTLLN